jgi:hypothetical protein
MGMVVAEVKVVVSRCWVGSHVVNTHLGWQEMVEP